MITPGLRDLVEQATQHAIRWNDDDAHTVAAALSTRSGRTVLGLNAHHFLGGPCGEISALANHASTCPDDPVVATVAVHGPTGQVIAPCGKCRQVLFDIDPTIRCVVRNSVGLEAIPVAELLPFAYEWRAAKDVQRIYMWEGYEPLIRDGSKRQTIRVDDPFRPGRATIVFEKENGGIVSIPAQVTSVTPTRRRDLTEDHALRDGFPSLSALHEALDRHYPGLTDDHMTDVVTFDLTD